VSWLSLQAARGHRARGGLGRLLDGTLFQVGRSSDTRDDLLGHFRSRVLIVLASI